MDFPVVDLTHDETGDVAVDGLPEGQGGGIQGSVNGTELAATLEELRAEISSRVGAGANDPGLRLTELNLKLAITAEGKVAFIAKGAVEASVEARFTWHD